ncbi:MAG: type II toxin-antitoxin system RelE/ParE family toxin [Flexilinea flocculi]|jgi:mRNA-degrading endonuclease RelE of RelBE toxin-antitoxin system|nr:type II toxin-antitoxin system RelE/ParE family toxin [Flexilinea flocculi]
MEITITNKAQKFMEKIEKSDYKTFDKLSFIIENIPNLILTRQGDIKQLQGQKGFFRLRAGNIRIIFRPDRNANKIVIENIDFRGNEYKQ